MVNLIVLLVGQNYWNEIVNLQMNFFVPIINCVVCQKRVEEMKISINRTRTSMKIDNIHKLNVRVLSLLLYWDTLKYIIEISLISKGISAYIFFICMHRKF